MQDQRNSTEAQGSPSAAQDVRRARTLVGVVGITAAAALFVSIPADESGRKVEATIDASTGSATIRHISGPQYLRAYRDIAGIATACDGITPGVRMGQTYTPQQCTQMLERELIIHAEGVMACTPGLRQRGRDHQRIAGVSLAYNIGVRGYCGSTVARRFNAGDWRGGCEAILMWDKARVNGQLRQVRGLTVRRQRERAECLRGLA